MKRLTLCIPVIGWAVVIYGLSCLSTDALGFFSQKFVRKIGHMVEYFILALLVYLAIRKAFRLSEEGATALAGIVPLCYALSDEFHQRFVPTRICDIRDVCIDMIGVTCFFLALDYCRARRRTSRSSSCI